MRSIAEIFRSYAEFDAQGRHVNGTDKESNHRYGEAYEQILSVNYSLKTYREPDKRCQHRTEVKLMMEIGVADGSSLCAWREVFPNALIVGMDIHHSDKAHGERIEFRIGDQRSKQDCENAAAGRQFDLIVEDATHQLENNLVTLLYLWPFVRSGGLYVIEEFGNIGALRSNITSLWPNLEIIDTVGPFGGIEPLVVLRKPR